MGWGAHLVWSERGADSVGVGASQQAVLLHLSGKGWEEAMQGGGGNAQGTGGRLGDEARSGHRSETVVANL